MASPPGITSSDFTTIPLGDVGTTVVRKPKTKTTGPISGDETITHGTAENMTAYIVRRDQGTWTLDKEGRIQGGDAIMLVAPTQSISEDDLCIWQGGTYQARTVLKRYAGDEEMYIVANLFLEE